jgi:hypothetical protein
MDIFEISIKNVFFDTPNSTLSTKKDFHLIEGSMCDLYELKSPKYKQPLNIL